MPSRPAILGRVPSYLLDLDLHGLVLRYTTAPGEVVVDDRKGLAYTYAPGLDVADVPRVLGESVDSVGFSIARWASPGWGRLRARGFRFGLSSATLRRHYDGQLLEATEVLISGVLVGASYGAETELFSAGIERQLREQGMIPHATHRIADDTWPVSTPNYKIDPAALGLCYPVLVGVQGTGATPSPAYMVEWAFGALGGPWSRLLISYGHIAASTCTLHDISRQEAEAGDAADPTQTGRYSRTVIRTQDLLGQDVSMVDCYGIPLPKRETDYRVSLDGGGGVYNRDRTAPLSGAGEILRWLLEEWTSTRIDAGRMEAARAVLDAYRLSFTLSDRARVWDIIRSDILPLLPGDWVEGPAGGYVQVRRMWADRADVSAHLVAGIDDPRANVERTAPLSSALDRVYNRVTVRYAPGGQQGQPLRSVTVAAGEEDRSSYRAMVSQSLYGVRELEITAGFVSDDATAARIARDLVMQHAIPAETTEVLGRADLDYLEPGDVVAYSDDSIPLSEELVVIDAKTTTEDGVAFALRLLDDPARILRGTT